MYVFFLNYMTKNGTLRVYMSTPAIFESFHEAFTRLDIHVSHKSEIDLMYFLLEHLPR